MNRDSEFFRTRKIEEELNIWRLERTFMLNEKETKELRLEVFFFFVFCRMIFSLRMNSRDGISRHDNATLWSGSVLASTARRTAVAGDINYQSTSGKASLMQETPITRRVDGSYNTECGKRGSETPFHSAAPPTVHSML